jgi:cystathionine gamma-lyase
MEGHLDLSKSGFSTRAIHAGFHPDSTGTVVTPIYTTSTFCLDIDKPLGENKYIYSRFSHPNRNNLEECIASLECTKYCRAFASGMAAVAAILHTLRPGDEVITSEDIYGGTMGYFMKEAINSQGLSFKMADYSHLDQFEKLFTEKTKIVWLESPSNPLLKVHDIKKVAEIAHKHKALLVADNTFMSPYLQNPIKLGADIVMHSCTKYISGHSDLIMGVVCTNSDDLDKALYSIQKSLGSCAGPFECYLAVRGLKTLCVRMKTAEANTQKLAEFLSTHPKVEKVYFPGLKTDPGYELQKTQARGFGSMLSMTLKGNAETTKNFVKSLKLVAYAVSLGACETLCTIPGLTTHLCVDQETRKKLGVTDTLIRFAIGIEDYEDILEDFTQAFDKLK